MPTAGQRTELIVFQRASTSEDTYGQQVLTWPGTTLATRRARVRFGTAQEQREAAQEGGVQTATFECESSSALRAVTLKDRISYLGSDWDLTEIAPLDRKIIRFTGTRAL